MKLPIDANLELRWLQKYAHIEVAYAGTSSLSLTGIRTGDKRKVSFAEFGRRLKPSPMTLLQLALIYHRGLRHDKPAPRAEELSQTPGVLWVLQSTCDKHRYVIAIYISQRKPQTFYHPSHHNATENDAAAAATKHLTAEAYHAQCCWMILIYMEISITSPTKQKLDTSSHADPYAYSLAA